MTKLPFDERLAGLLRAAAGVFARKGYHATTMRDVARASGMSLAGMYHYVDGKEQLLYLIQQRCFADVLEGAEQALDATADPQAAVRAFIEHHLEFFAAHLPEMKVLSHEADSLTGKRAEEIRGLKRRYADLLQRVIAAANGRRPSVSAYALFGMMNWTYTWYRPDGPLPPGALADAFADLFLHGMRGPATVRS
jgi:AcrR family transcriptional regulator